MRHIRQTIERLLSITTAAIFIILAHAETVAGPSILAVVLVAVALVVVRAAWGTWDYWDMRTYQEAELKQLTELLDRQHETGE